MAKCYTCGTIYDGISCPVCSAKEKLEKQQKDMQRSVEKSAKEQQEAIDESFREQERLLEEQRESVESAIEDARIEMEHSLREAEAKHKKTTSEAWKLQADAKADRAYELCKAGLHDESIKLCFEAISQDPGNIKPYRYAAWSFEKLGQDIKARELLKKQINLLKTSDYKNSEDPAVLVLNDILEMKNNDDLIQSFLAVSKSFSYFPIILINKLIEHCLYDSAYEVYNNTFEHGITSLSNKDEHLLTLTTCACGIDLSNYIQGSPSGIGALEGYLESVPFAQRSYVFEAFKRMRSAKEKNPNIAVFSDKTIKLLREKILKRYEEWKPEIQKEFRESAAKEGQMKASEKSSPNVIGWIVGIISLMFIWVPIYSTTKATAGGAVLVVGASILTGIITSKVVLSRMNNKLEEELITSMKKKEKEDFDRILS